MYQTIPISKLHNEYHSWIIELNFCKEEISIFENHLGEIINRHDKQKITARIAYFQDQFELWNYAIDELKHDLNTAEKQLATFAKALSYDGFINIKMDNHSRLRKEMMILREVFSDLKKDYRKFEVNCNLQQLQLEIEESSMHYGTMN